MSIDHLCLSSLAPGACIISEDTENGHITGPGVVTHYIARYASDPGHQSSPTKMGQHHISQSEASILVSRPMRSQERLTFGDAELITVITLTMAWCHKGELWREKLPLEKVKVGTGFMSEVVCRVTRQMLAGNGTFITRRGQNIRRGAREKHCHWSLASVSSSPCSLWRQWALARVLVSALIWIICPGMSTPDAGAQRKFWRKMRHKDV